MQPSGPHLGFSAGPDLPPESSGTLLLSVAAALELLGAPVVGCVLLALFAVAAGSF